MGRLDCPRGLLLFGNDGVRVFALGLLLLLELLERPMVSCGCPGLCPARLSPWVLSLHLLPSPHDRPRTWTTPTPPHTTTNAHP